MARLAPKISVISEYEPVEAFALLTADDLDLALTYDYNLAPASPGAVHEAVPLWSIRWGLGVPAAQEAHDIAAFADATWIVNSRNTADETAVRTLASLAGFTPTTGHQIDSLDLVEDLIVGGFGVGLLPVGRPTAAGVTVLPLQDPDVILTAYAVTRRGRSDWSPLRAVLNRMRPRPGEALSRPQWPRPRAASQGRVRRGHRR